jgi:hypothetical protein
LVGHTLVLHIHCGSIQFCHRRKSPRYIKEKLFFFKKKKAREYEGMGEEKSAVVMCCDAAA